MKIKNFVKYLKEVVREDDLGHLNDGLPANKNEGRWPDDDYDYEDDGTKGYGDFDDWYDDDDKFTSPKKSSNPKFNDDDDDDDFDIYSDDED
jgi:hypothetical protein